MEFLIGLWPMLWHFSAGAILISACLLGAWFSPIAKAQFIWAAVCVALGLGAYTWGVENEKARCSVQLSELFKDVENEGTKIRQEAEVSIPPLPVARPATATVVRKHGKPLDAKDRAH
jgi:hypothetical protein